MPRRTSEIWRNVLKQFEESGKTQEEFATERGIPLSTLRSWIYKIRRANEEGAAILPVRVVASAAPTARRRGDEEAAVEVMLVRFASGTATEFIADVVTRLRRC
jgi:transposase-like protein